MGLAGVNGRWSALVAVILLSAGCVPVGGSSRPDSGNTNANVSTNSNSDGPVARDKFALWSQGTQLRGANVFQRRVYPDLDGPDFLGPGPLGPPYTQDDFDRLAALGANYVNISHTGLFTQMPPYEVDLDVQTNLDRLLEMIAAADMFAVVSFRSGPGRGEFALIEIPGLPSELRDQSVWQDAAAQEGWASMWRYTAERYRDNPIVVGYDLMVEPNAPAGLFDIFDPAEFDDRYGGTLADWNQLHPRLTASIRAVDAQTPIIAAAGNFSAVDWLPFVQVTDDERTVYAVHQYAPFVYTHQDPPALNLRYPGVFDADGDGTPDTVNREWLADMLATVRTFSEMTGRPVVANEFGVQRWEPGAAGFAADELDVFEQLGINHAIWLWMASHPPAAEDDAFNFRHGPDPANHVDVPSELLDAIQSNWQRNAVRPSS